ncbi:PTS system mannose-specific IIB component [Bacillus oleivorans]|uniref:PTS system mannose-specific IIB component n=1 Tax=Bacillus oleivorans TaxID=1448271 RepID=A0A285CPK2_9BACI|nr:PTS sugar transporter subunit IIB [Bacillus oleivorans]SNX69482.1 PTS system mannose-specific IIB component [Bacillus oleivorans]
MGISFVRIDDRLIHGQVATTWVRNYNIEQVAVINDQLSKDPLQESVIKMAAPTGVYAVLIDINSFIAVAKKGFKKKTMLIFTNPTDVLKVVENGVELPFINVGGMKYREGRAKLTEAVSVTEEDMEAFKKLVEHGLDIEIQMVPSSEKQKITKFLGLNKSEGRNV